ncbi:MAG TPA: FapA family protein, partial [Thermaerobacter sp.]
MAVGRVAELPAETVILVTAKSVDDAVRRAARLAGRPAREARAEVIDPGRRLFARWLLRPMVVRVSFPAAAPRAPVPEEPGEPGAGDGRPGGSGGGAEAAADVRPTLARVRKGRLEILPGSSRRPAILRPLPGVILRVNGEAVNGPVAVTAADRVEVEVPNTAARPGSRGGGGEAVARPLHITISSDGMWAELALPTRPVAVLGDAGPAPMLELRPITVLRPPAGLTLEDVLAALRQRGVVHGIDRDVLRRVLEEGAPGPVVVARGTPAVHGRDGQFRPVVPVDPAARQARQAGRQGAARGDPRLGGAWPSVPEGALLGHITPPSPGRPGRDVRGREIAPRPGRPARVTCGPGALRVPAPGGEEEVRATRAGRPVFQRVGRNAWRVDVVPLLVHEGDVDAQTGPVRFHGDIVVTGNVREGMKVVASGRIHVHGYVENGYLQADGDIRVDGGVIQSRVVAGARIWLYGELKTALPPLQAGVDRLIAAMRVVEHAASFRRQDMTRFGPGRLVRLLLEMKFGSVSEQARVVHELLRRYEGELDHDVERLRRPVEALASGRPGDDFDVHALADGLRAAGELLEWFEGSGGAKAVVAHAHNAVVLSAGQVVVGSEGTYHARVAARDRVVVQGPVVGGTVEADRSITVVEAGSPALPATVLAVGEAGTIRAGRAHENVWVRVGGQQRR